ncbi:MAG TPA: hypothetical protein VFU15_13720 [Bacteroidia bacterium]|nr:hypothetical protein [Bacteroidia bacterium]
MYNQGNFYQQPPQQPQKKGNNRLVLWIVISALITGLLATAVYFAAQMGKKFGTTISNLSEQAMQVSDSLEAQGNEETYMNLRSRIDADSSLAPYASKLDSLQAWTEAIRAEVLREKDGFKASLGSGQPGFFDKRPAEKYFIATGKATMLKRDLIAYRSRVLNDMPGDIRDTLLKNQIDVDAFAKLSVLGSFAQWERMKFDQPATTVFMNIKMIITQVRNFESSVLSRYSSKIR